MAVVQLEAATLAAGPVQLRAWHDGDVERVQQACSDVESQRWLTALPSPYRRADAEAYVASRAEEMALGHAVYWCVADPTSDTCLASMALMLGGRGDATGELGWWAHPDARGRGVVTRAARLAAEHAFADSARGGLGLRRLLVRTRVGNAASAAVATRLGFTLVGRDRSAVADRDGARHDELRFDLLPGELRRPE
jgi:RimJ/RimL family protein N-acetyltransferase